MRLAAVRSYAWRQFGSIRGVEVSSFGIRNQTKRAFEDSGIPANLRFATALDAADNIKAYLAAAKELCKRQIFARTKDEVERKRLFTLLKFHKWKDDPFLRRIMRKAYRHGVNHVDNQIVVEAHDYRWFEHGGYGWIEVLSLVPRKRIAIPLASSHPISGTIRLIVDESGVSVHHTIEVPAGKPCGPKTIGVDRGYTEVFVDSDGEEHGKGLGTVLSAESDHLKLVYASRNKLAAIAEKSTPAKRVSRIQRHNLGLKKLDRRKKRQRLKVNNLISKACHSVCDKACVIASEDLTSTIRSTKPRSKNQTRRLSGWVKGQIAKSLESISHRRGSSVIVVNCAYTSQTDSQTGLLEGSRVGDLFYCASGGGVTRRSQCGPGTCWQEFTIPR